MSLGAKACKMCLAGGRNGNKLLGRSETHCSATIWHKYCYQQRHLFVVVVCGGYHPSVDARIWVSLVLTHLSTRRVEIVAIYSTAHILWERTPARVFIVALHPETGSGSAAHARRGLKCLHFFVPESILLCEQLFQRFQRSSGIGSGSGGASASASP